jgi:hypothetical protein
MASQARFAGAVDGCGQAFGAAWLASMTVLAGCGASAAEMVKTRGAFDFRCPADKVAVTQLSENTYGADGCGQRTVYALKCPRAAVVAAECDLAREPAAAPTP